MSSLSLPQAEVLLQCLSVLMRLLSWSVSGIRYQLSSYWANNGFLFLAVRGVFTDSHHHKIFPSSYFTTLQKSYASYLKRLHSSLSKDIDVEEATKAASVFDYMLTDHPEKLAELFRVSPCLSKDDNALPLHPRDFQKKVVFNGPDSGSIYDGLVCLVDAVPSYELFEKRVAIFSESDNGTSTFFCLRAVSDTKYIRDTLKATGGVPRRT